MNERAVARLLLSVLREDWDDARNHADTGRAGGDAFARLAKACDVHPTVHAILERNDRFDLVSRPSREALTTMRRKCRHDNLLLLAVLEETLDLLATRGIPTIALKGVAVLHRFDQPFDSRAMDDIDLLIPAGRVDEALSALAEAGFTVPGGDERRHWLRSSFEMPVYSRGPIPVLVEIHWDLGQEVRYSIPIDEIRSRAVPLDVAARRCHRLDDHDAVAHLLLHHVQHYFDRRLKWMIDLRGYVRQAGFSWPSVADRLRRWHGSVAAGMALRHVRKLLPETVPESTLDAIPTGAWRRLAGLPLRTGHPLDWYRGTRSRAIQLMIASLLLEDVRELPNYIRHRTTRDDDEGASRVERTR